MKKMILVLLLAIMLTGCSATVVKEKETDSPASRFMELETTARWMVVADTETGVMYAVSTGGYSRGVFTLLVDENGKPLIYGDKK